MTRSSANKNKRKLGLARTKQSEGITKKDDKKDHAPAVTEHRQVRDEEDNVETMKDMHLLKQAMQTSILNANDDESDGNVMEIDAATGTYILEGSDLDDALTEPEELDESFVASSPLKLSRSNSDVDIVDKVAEANVDLNTSPAVEDMTDATNESDAEDETPDSDINPIEDAFKSVKRLPYVEALLIAPEYLHTPVVNMDESFYNIDIDRLIAVSAHLGTEKIRNLALCDPGDLVYDKWLKHTKSDPYSLFYVPALVKHCSFFDDTALSKQIGFYPFSNTWYRAVANLGKAFKANTLFFSNFNHVITASTKTVSLSADTQPVAPASNRRKIERTVDGALPYNAHIPVFDGTDGFDLNNLGEQDRVFYEPDPGSAVLVIFTAHTYPPYKSQISRNKIDKTDTIVSLNLHAVVIVNSSDPEFNPKQRIDVEKEALGVEFPQAKPKTKKSAMNKTNDEPGQSSQRSVSPPNVFARRSGKSGAYPPVRF